MSSLTASARQNQLPVLFLLHFIRIVITSGTWHLFSIASSHCPLFVLQHRWWNWIQKLQRSAPATSPLPDFLFVSLLADPHEISAFAGNARRSPGAKVAEVETGFELRPSLWARRASRLLHPALLYYWLYSFRWYLSTLLNVWFIRRKYTSAEIHSRQMDTVRFRTSPDGIFCFL